MLQPSALIIRNPSASLCAAPPLAAEATPLKAGSEGLYSVDTELIRKGKLQIRQGEGGSKSYRKIKIEICEAIQSRSASKSQTDLLVVAVIAFSVYRVQYTGGLDLFERVIKRTATRGDVGCKDLVDDIESHILHRKTQGGEEDRPGTRDAGRRDGEFQHR